MPVLTEESIYCHNDGIEEVPCIFIGCEARWASEFDMVGRSLELGGPKKRRS